VDERALAQLQASCEAAKQNLKACQRALRVALQFVADLEHRIEDYQNAEPKEAERNGNCSEEVGHLKDFVVT
jgi:hypothetical protein